MVALVAVVLPHFLIVLVDATSGSARILPRYASHFHLLGSLLRRRLRGWPAVTRSLNVVTPVVSLRLTVGAHLGRHWQLLFLLLVQRRKLRGAVATLQRLDAAPDLTLTVLS